MIIVELALIGVGLAMDAFAVSICKGLGMPKVKRKNAFIIGLFFGGFQALMPFLGWALGKSFEKYIIQIDHWIAFILLVFIGGKMIYEVMNPSEEDTVTVRDIPLDLKELMILAIATSIDALAVGVTFAFLNYPIMEAISIIGILTFIICVAGVYIGNYFGSRFKKQAELASGVILIMIGLKILLEHLGILSF